MVDLDLAYKPAVEVARLIRTKAVSPVEVMDNALARIEAVDAALNCFAFVYGEEALAKAREAERAVTSGAELGPLARPARGDQGFYPDARQGDDPRLARLCRLVAR